MRMILTTIMPNGNRQERDYTCPAGKEETVYTVLEGLCDLRSTVELKSVVVGGSGNRAKSTKPKTMVAKNSSWRVVKGQATSLKAGSKVRGLYEQLENNFPKDAVTYNMILKTAKQLKVNAGAATQLRKKGLIVEIK